MVIFGGLEFVAAGYVLNEIHKDNKRSKSEERRRRKRHEHKQNSISNSRPSRPTTQGQLMPPQYSHRPNSAPPPKMRPQHPPHPQMPGGMPIQTHTWPAQARPPTKTEVGQWYNRPPAQPQRPQPPPMPVPGMIQHNPTMHFDTKTGKWQTNMLPAEMQPGAGAGGKRSLSNVGLDAPKAMSVDHLPLVVRKRSESSVSSVSVSTASSSDEGMAYGKHHEKQKPRRIVSHERRRPSELSGSTAATSVPRVAPTQPVELDWYATQKKSTQHVPPVHTPAMAQVMMNKDSRANTLPLPPVQQTGYSMSSPNLGVFEMDGAGVQRTTPLRPTKLQQGHGQNVFPVELDGRETQKYRAYRPG